MQNSHTFVPSVAPKSPPPFLKTWPVPNDGGAAIPDIGAHELFAATYDAPSIPVPDAFLRNTYTAVVVTGTSAQSFWLMVASAANTLPSPPPVLAEIFVHVPEAPERCERRFVMSGCATAPLLYTASITFDASGANASALHSFAIVLSMTAVVRGGDAPTLPVGLVFAPNPFVHDARVSAFEDLPTAQSIS